MLNAIVVDDEKPAREELVYLLNEAGGVKVVGQANCAADAIKKLRNCACDVLFLDINMPDATGLKLAEALQALKYPPFVVFVSAYSEYAVDAFEVKAVDYLLKPVEIDRLKRAINNVTERVKEKERLQKGKQIACERSGKKVLLSSEDILYCLARDDYAFIETADGRYFSTGSLSQMEQELEGFNFMRVHRGYIVNLAMIEDVETKDNGAINLKIRGCSEKVPVSRRKIPGLKKVLKI